MLIITLLLVIANTKYLQVETVHLYVSDPARAAAGTIHPSSRSYNQPLATQPRLPLPPQLETRCPRETGQFRECPMSFANLLEMRGHLPRLQGSHVPQPARVHLQPHPA